MFVIVPAFTTDYHSSMDVQEISFALAKAGNGIEFVPAGSTIFSAGEEGDCMYYLHRGAVDIIINDRCVGQLGVGNIFGEMSLIDGSVRSATARAHVDCEISSINSDTFLALVKESPHVSLDIMRMLAARLRKLNNTLL